jgi:hypothetical protein
MPKESHEEKYTHPQMREEIKEEIKQSDKGGKPGQWSARKSQLLTQEYEKRGGDYKGEKDERQKTSKSGPPRMANPGRRSEGREGGETARYLPKEAWENMTEEEKEDTERKKREGSRKGEQYVSNTDEAKNARTESQAPPIKGYDALNVEEVKEKLDGLSEGDKNKVLTYEKQHKNRKTLVQQMERKI